MGGLGGLDGLWVVSSFTANVTKQEKEAGTYFVLMYQSRNIIEQFMKIYFIGPIKVLQFFTCGRIKK